MFDDLIRQLSWVMRPASETDFAIAGTNGSGCSLKRITSFIPQGQGRARESLLTMAFEDDPVCRWIWRDRQKYRESFPRFALAFAGGAIHLASAHYYGDFSGVAMWLPPGSHPDEESLLEVIDQTVFKERKNAMFSMFEQMEAYHPSEPHWYLPLIGVEPASHGRGIGSMLQRHMLDRCDDERVLAYLEATSPRNMVLYKRLGFEPIGRIQVADCPPVVPMLRTPR